MFDFLQKVWVIDGVSIKEGVVTGIRPDSRFTISLICRYGEHIYLEEFDTYHVSDIRYLNEMGVFTIKREAEKALKAFLLKELGKLDVSLL